MKRFTLTWEGPPPSLHLRVKGRGGGVDIKMAIVAPSGGITFYGIDTSHDALPDLDNLHFGCGLPSLSSSAAQWKL